MKGLKYFFEYPDALTLFEKMRGFDQLEMILHSKNKITEPKHYDFCEKILEEFYYNLHEFP